MKKHACRFLVTLIIGTALYFTLIYQSTASTPYAQFSDPSGKYMLVVYPKNPPLVHFFAMGFPGQSGDNPAVVYLKSPTGTIYNKTHIDMAQLVQSPVWEPTRVHVRLVLDMPLPR